MTRDEAITKLTNILNDDIYSWHPAHAEALEMAMEALKANLVNESGGLVKDSQGDCISRQAAIDEIRRCRFVVDAIKKIRGLPSAQPEPHERVFKEIVVEYPTYSIYPEFDGKPYFSIKYTINGQRYIGYGTFKPEVLSEYLKKYFILPKQPEQQ